MSSFGTPKHGISTPTCSDWVRVSENGQLGTKSPRNQPTASTMLLRVRSGPDWNVQPASDFYSENDSWSLVISKGVWEWFSEVRNQNGQHQISSQCWVCSHPTTQTSVDHNVDQGQPPCDRNDVHSCLLLILIARNTGIVAPLGRDCFKSD